MEICIHALIRPAAKRADPSGLPKKRAVLFWEKERQTAGAACFPKGKCAHDLSCRDMVRDQEAVGSAVTSTKSPAEVILCGTFFAVNFDPALLRLSVRRAPKTRLSKLRLPFLRSLLILESYPDRPKLFVIRIEEGIAADARVRLFCKL